MPKILIDFSGNGIWCSKLAIEDRSNSLVHWSRWQLAIEDTTPMDKSGPQFPILNTKFDTIKLSV